VAKKGRTKGGRSAGLSSDRVASQLLRSIVRPATDYLPLTLTRVPVPRTPVVLRVVKKAPLITKAPVKAQSWSRSNPAIASWRSPQYIPESSPCASRKTRREVIFALNKTGKGAKAKRRFTQRSKERC